MLKFEESLSFWGIENTSSYFSFQATYCEHQFVYFFADRRLTLRPLLKGEWLENLIKQMFMFTRHPTGFLLLLFGNLHCVLSVFIFNVKRRFREHIPVESSSYHIASVFDTRSQNNILKFYQLFVLHVAFKSRKLLCYRLFC